VSGHIQFIRLDPTVAVVVRAAVDRPPASDSATPLLDPSATIPTNAIGIHPDAILLEPGARPGVLALGASVLEVEVRTGGAPLFVRATLDGTLAGGVDGALGLRLARPDEATAARLETFITRHRKSEHIRIVRDRDTASDGVTTGFERFRLPHEGLPELDLGRVDLSTRVLGKKLAAPILISCMTGGSELAKVVNRRLAKAAHACGLALGLGSQRAMLKAPDLTDTYAVRDLAPDVLLIGNIGAVQLNFGVTAADVERLAREVGADAIALHLNPLQEAVQPEGDVDFSGLKARVAMVAAAIGTPVVLKEVGNGISRRLARWAAGTRIAALDTAGAGGTNWAKVESYRAQSERGERLARSFGGAGIPTVDSLLACREEFGTRTVIASGGVKDGIDVAKAIALGADMVGLARPFLEAAAKSEEAAIETARLIVDQLRVAMFCAGAGTIEELRRTTLERISER